MIIIHLHNLWKAKFFILCCYLWWGCSRNLKLITLGSERVNPSKFYSNMKPFSFFPSIINNLTWNWYHDITMPFIFSGMIVNIFDSCIPADSVPCRIISIDRNGAEPTWAEWRACHLPWTRAATQPNRSSSQVGHTLTFCTSMHEFFSCGQRNSGNCCWALLRKKTGGIIFIEFRSILPALSYSTDRPVMLITCSYFWQ